MATTLSYTIPAYVPFTKILSASINQDKTDIKNRLNWAGGTDTSTGLGDDNLQSNTASAETKASLTTQGITLTAVAGQGSNGNSITITFTSGGTAGSEVVSVSGKAITVQVASGISTVTQVAAAINSSVLGSKLVTATGVSSSTVVAATILNLSGGVSSTGVTRTTKLGLDTANYVLINDATGKISSEPILALSRGGIGTVLTITNPGDTIQVNSTGTSFITGTPPVAPQTRVFSFYQFS